MKKSEYFVGYTEKMILLLKKIFLNSRKKYISSLVKEIDIFGQRNFFKDFKLKIGSYMQGLFINILKSSFNWGETQNF